MRCSRRLALLSLKSLLISIILISGLQAVELELKETASVEGSYILLKDICRVNGKSVLLGDVKVKRSPPPCRSEYVTKEEVARSIYSFLRGRRIPDNFSLKLRGAERCRVERVCTRIDSSKLKERLKKFIEERFSGIKVVSLYAPSITVPSKNFRDSVEVKEKGNHYVRLKYTVFAGNETFRTFWITARVEKLVKTVVAAKFIPKGKIITADDLQVIELPERKARLGFPSKGEVIGKVARVNIKKGSTIRESLLKPNYIVRRGDTVRISYRRGAISVQIAGRAMENGALGDIIKVENVSTGKKLRCKVIGEDSVKFLEGY